MRTSRGFTLIEVLLVLAIAAVLGAIVIRQGMAARQSAAVAGGAFDLALRLGATKARALAEARDHVVLVVDAQDAACARQADRCGHVWLLRNPTPAFTLDGFDPTPPFTTVEYVDDEALPVNTHFTPTGAWSPPVPFDNVAVFDPAMVATCAGDRACFGIRFRSNGDVEAVFVGGAAPPATPGGFAFVLGPIESPGLAAEHRAVLVSFPAGIVKTASF